jgi:glycosyltransferase involved in cell wall biosynthesis
LKILVVTPFFKPVIGGVETVLDTTCAGLVQMGHEVRVLTSSVCTDLEPEGCSSSSPVASGVTRSDLLRVPDNEMISGADFNFRSVETLLRKVLEEFHPDVVHFHNYQMKYYAMFLNAFLAGIGKSDSSSSPVALNTVHNDYDDEFSQYTLTYAPLEQVVAVTKRGALQLIEGGLPSSKVSYVPNTVDVEKYRSANGQGVRKLLGVEQTDPLILFPSRLVGREGNLILDSESGKGLNVMMRAMPEILESVPGAKLLILGNDSVFEVKVANTKRRLKEIAQRIGMSAESILFFDRFVSNEMLPQVFAASDIVVSLALRETFGMVFLEGMASGKPVVGVNSEIGGVPEVVPDRYAGYLVPPNDAHSTARSVIGILSNEKLQARLGFNGVKWVRKKYDVRIVLPQLVTLYGSLIRRKSPLGKSIEGAIGHLQFAPRESLNNEIG